MGGRREGEGGEGGGGSDRKGSGRQVVWNRSWKRDVFMVFDGMACRCSRPAGHGASSHH